MAPHSGYTFIAYKATQKEQKNINGTKRITHTLHRDTHTHTHTGTHTGSMMGTCTLDEIAGCAGFYTAVNLVTQQTHTHTPLQTHTHGDEPKRKHTTVDRDFPGNWPPVIRHPYPRAHTRIKTHTQSPRRTHTHRNVRTHTHSYTRTQLANRNIDFLPLFLETRFKGVEGGTVFFLLSFFFAVAFHLQQHFAQLFSERAFCFTSNTAHCSEFSPGERKRVNSGETERNRENCRNTGKTSIFVS